MCRDVPARVRRGGPALALALLAASCAAPPPPKPPAPPIAAAAPAPPPPPEPDAIARSRAPAASCPTALAAPPKPCDALGDQPIGGCIVVGRTDRMVPMGAPEIALLEEEILGVHTFYLAFDVGDRWAATPVFGWTPDHQSGNAQMDVRLGDLVFDGGTLVKAEIDVDILRTDRVVDGGDGGTSEHIYVRSGHVLAVAINLEGGPRLVMAVEQARRTYDKSRDGFAPKSRPRRAVELQVSLVDQTMVIAKHAGTVPKDLERLLGSHALDVAPIIHLAKPFEEPQDRMRIVADTQEE